MLHLIPKPRHKPAYSVEIPVQDIRAFRGHIKLLNNSTQKPNLEKPNISDSPLQRLHWKAEDRGTHKQHR